MLAAHADAASTPRVLLLRGPSVESYRPLRGLGSGIDVELGGKADELGDRSLLQLGSLTKGFVELSGYPDSKRTLGCSIHVLPPLADGIGPRERSMPPL